MRAFWAAAAKQRPLPLARLSATLVTTAPPEEARMTGETPESTQKQPQQAAIEHIAEAHSILKRLRDRLDQHPELEQAIEELELALSKLTLRTGGML